jgi:hypothetical protein
MPTQIGELGVTFPDTTLQTTAAIPGAAGFGLTVMTVFTNNGFFVVPAGITRVRVTVIGGGGGGGAGGDYYGGGGGGGGTAIKTISGLTPGQSINVTVGAGGIINDFVSPNGTAGGTSAFGTYCSATGGAGGPYNGGPGETPYSGGGGGAGGTGINGDITIPGGVGGYQFRYSYTAGEQTYSYTMVSAGGGTYLAPFGSSGYGAGGRSQGNGYKGVVIVEY